MEANYTAKNHIIIDSEVLEFVCLFILIYIAAHLTISTLGSEWTQNQTPKEQDQIMTNSSNTIIAQGQRKGDLLDSEVMLKGGIWFWGEWS